MRKALILSHLINERTPLYGGEKSIVIKKVKSIKNGDSCNKTHLSFSAHTGTHIDTPKHFLDKGKAVSDLMPKDLFFKNACLIEVKNTKPGHIIKENDLGRIRNCDILFIKTGFEKLRNKDVYWKNSPALDGKLGSWLKKSCPSIRAVGIDFISVSNIRNKELGRQAHRSLLSNGICLIEDMKLKDIKSAPASVIVAPLLLDKADAAPCTVLGIYN